MESGPDEPPLGPGGSSRWAARSTKPNWCARYAAGIVDTCAALDIEDIEDIVIVWFPPGYALSDRLGQRPAATR
jgi:hypothetical protein